MMDRLGGLVIGITVLLIVVWVGLYIAGLSHDEAINRAMRILQTMSRSFQ